MLGSHLAVRVDEACTTTAAQNFALFLSEELIAVCTLVEVVLVFLKQQLKLFHKEATYNLVFTFFENIQPVEAHFFCHLTDNVRIDTGHVDLYS